MQNDYSHTDFQHYSRVASHWAYENDYHFGHIATPHGFVLLHADHAKFPYTSMAFIFKGRIFRRVIEEQTPVDSLDQLAHKFAEQCVAQQEAPTDA